MTCAAGSGSVMLGDPNGMRNTEGGPEHRLRLSHDGFHIPKSLKSKVCSSAACALWRHEPWVLVIGVRILLVAIWRILL